MSKNINRLNMGQISDYIINLYNQLSEDEIQPIDVEIVDDAVSVINNQNANGDESLFLLLSAINLLNAAIKTEKHKSQLSYGYIKTKVSIIAETLLKSPSSFPNTSVYYEQKQKCIYFLVYGITFSFHQIPETELIKNVASKNLPITWMGIRLQRIAQKIFLYSKELFLPVPNFDTDMQRNNNNSNMLTNIIEKLVPCPDCGHKISTSAHCCPQCGCVLTNSHDILDGVKVGYSIRITYSGSSSVGKIESIKDDIISLSLVDEKWLKVRISNITSVELIDLKSASNLNGNLNCSKELEHYSS